MKRKIITLLTAMIATAGMAQKSNGGYPITPVPFTAVKVASNSFWGQRLETSRQVTVPLAFSKCESEGRYKNFERAAHPSDSYDVSKLMGLSFDDTDPYKTIEGASYILQTYPDKKLKQYIDSVLDIIGSAQESDGYLYTARTQNPKKPHHWAGDKRWSKVEDLSHELYNLGHMVEGAVAHWQATGSRKFLDIAIRYADCVVREVGPNPGQACVVPGHQIAEMALCKLYLATGNRKYLDQAKFFLDYRGKTTIRQEYSQSHKPVVEQDEAVGHAVRAAYMYAGMADVAALTGDADYIKAIDRIWDNIVGKKLYITGGIGATSNGEAFGKNYELPNMSAYAETCAAIGNVYVNYRLFLLHGESKYFDVLERSLYNGLISGVSMDGGGFFYPNPLESMGQHQRQAWFGCACCPSNICRFLPSLPGYVYAVKDNNLYVNLFLSNSATMKVSGKNVSLTQSTNYPWDGDIAIRMDRNKAGSFGLKIRIPGWIKGQPVPSDLYYYSDGKRPNYTIMVNGKVIEPTITDDGYCTINRRWKKGDVVTIHFDMEVRTVRANTKVEADRGQVSFERGPIVYCAEWADNDFDIMSMLLNQKPKFTESKLPYSQFISDKYKNTLRLYQGQNLTTLTTQAQALAYDKEGRLTVQNVNLKLIPYFTWCHRGSGNMKVWMAQNVSASRPSTPPTLASQAEIASSTPSRSMKSIVDGLVPADENDRSVPYFHWWPKQGGNEWVTYTFANAKTIQSATVYWFDDQPWGGCKVPDSWIMEYQDESGAWKPVSHADQYPVKKGQACIVNFDPVKTKAVRLNVYQPEKYSSGLFEWSVN
ncbi:beta-L-arabinofuranosidase domain-containing protein [Hallella bergensis]|uniref:glycoside hydrolase family 127 protein n=2 Tax=Hallella bergensis TaxID=242750 RepID=UPI0023F4B718|nr:beta-L-arabinofuranosidase domain-containing protein [Hallella bergensis]